jgi:hypothetical protein
MRRSLDCNLTDSSVDSYDAFENDLPLQVGRDGRLRIHRLDLSNDLRGGEDVGGTRGRSCDSRQISQRFDYQRSLR